GAASWLGREQRPRHRGSVRGAGVSQQTVDITPSSRLTSPVGCLQREQQHLLHRLWAVRLGADEMACELESPTAQVDHLDVAGQRGDRVPRWCFSDASGRSSVPAQIKRNSFGLREFLLKPDFVMDFEPGGFQAAGHMGSCISSVGPQSPVRATEPPEPAATAAAAAVTGRGQSNKGFKPEENQKPPTPPQPQQRNGQLPQAAPAARIVEVKPVRRPATPPAGDSSSSRSLTGEKTKNNEMDDQSEKNAGSEPLSGLMYNSLQKAPSTQYAELKKIARLVEEDTINKELLVQNLRYAVQVLEAVYEDETKRLCNEDDDLPEVSPNEVPSEVRDWLASTFTRSQTSLKQNKEKPHFRSVANAIRAGIMVERIYRRLSSSSSISVPPNVLLLLKAGLDEWCFDVFELNEVSENHAMKFVGFELLHKYDLISKFKINSSVLENFLYKCEEGYSKWGNPYHNLVHGADVAQTCHFIMHDSKLVNWLTDLEIFATIIAALIHDYEHTGTTNNFHINTNSDLALLYNDKGVLENYHQIKNMKQLLSMPEKIDKEKALALMLHCADISHPGKRWDLHYRWTLGLLEEFFRQGDRERALDLPCSPLCDRTVTMVAQSQVGFIDFIMEPSFNVLGDMLEKILGPLFEQQRKAGGSAGPERGPLTARPVKAEASASAGPGQTSSRRTAPPGRLGLRSTSESGLLAVTRWGCCCSGCCCFCSIGDLAGRPLVTLANFKVAARPAPARPPTGARLSPALPGRTHAACNHTACTHAACNHTACTHTACTNTASTHTASTHAACNHTACNHPTFSLIKFPPQRQYKLTNPIQKAAKFTPEFHRHGVVDDWIDGGVDEDQKAADHAVPLGDDAILRRYKAVVGHHQAESARSTVGISTFLSKTSGHPAAKSGAPAAVESGAPAAAESGAPAAVESGAPAAVESGAPAAAESGAPAAVESGAPAAVESGAPAARAHASTADTGRGICMIDFGLHVAGGPLSEHLNDHIRLKLLDSAWSPSANYSMPYSTRIVKGKAEKRYLRHEHLQKHSFLAFSEARSGLFCRFCALFGPASGDVRNQQLGFLVSKPLSRYDRLFGANGYVTSHAATAYHQDAMARAATFKQQAAARSDVVKQLDEARQRQAAENRNRLRPIVKTLFALWKTKHSTSRSLRRWPAFKCQGYDGAAVMREAADCRSRQRKLLTLCDTRWVERNDAVLVFSQLFASIVEFLDFCESASDCDPRTAAKAQMLKAACTMPNFIVALHMMGEVMAVIRPLSSFLQKVSIDLFTAGKHIENVRVTLEKMQAEASTAFKSIWSSASEAAAEADVELRIPRRRGCQQGRGASEDTPEEHFRADVYEPFLQHILSQFQQRFGDQAQHDAFLQLTCLLPKYVHLYDDTEGAAASLKDTEGAAASLKDTEGAAASLKDTEGAAASLKDTEGAAASLKDTEGAAASLKDTEGAAASLKDTEGAAAVQRNQVQPSFAKLRMILTWARLRNDLAVLKVRSGRIGWPDSALGADDRNSTLATAHAEQHQRRQVGQQQVANVQSGVSGICPVQPMAAGGHGVVEPPYRYQSGQVEPGRVVGEAAQPDGADDPLGPAHGAQGVRPHRPADGHVALDGEGRDGEGAGLHGHVGQVDVQLAAGHAEQQPVVADNVELYQNGDGAEQEHQQVGRGQRHQVAVGWRQQPAADSEHHRHHQGVSGHTNQQGGRGDHRDEGSDWYIVVLAALLLLRASLRCCIKCSVAAGRACPIGAGRLGGGSSVLRARLGRLCCFEKISDSSSSAGRRGKREVDEFETAIISSEQTRSIRNLVRGTPAQRRRSSAQGLSSQPPGCSAGSR
uniref:Phosphodiesterase n=2 Tax=Macrostomum lignano TaxID=282301 RepID=A0A1I8I0A0_9PLAT